MCLQKFKEIERCFLPFSAAWCRKNKSYPVCMIFYVSVIISSSLSSFEIRLWKVNWIYHNQCLFIIVSFSPSYKTNVSAEKLEKCHHTWLVLSISIFSPKISIFLLSLFTESLFYRCHFQFLLTIFGCDCNFSNGKEKYC